jgi:MFS family permease
MFAPARTSKAKDPWGAVFALGVTQITAWGSIYYSFALLMEPLQAALGASKGAVVGAFSLSLLASGLLSPLVGRLIDQHGGRWLMAGGSALGGLALCALAHVTTLPQLYVIWAVLGIAMAATLYDPAFAVLIQSFRSNYRRAITVLTLFGGFASTVFWPVTALLISRFGWRDAMLMLGVLQFIVCIPLHFLVLPRSSGARGVAMAGEHKSTSLRDVLRDRVFYLLCLAFTANALVFSAMSVHMLAMLEGKGLTSVQAAFVGAMVGPMQVLGRIIEMLFERRVSPSTVGVIAMGLLPMSLAVFLVADGTLALFAVFALTYGAGNGVMTIVRGTIPAELYGRAHYGAVNGAMAAPVLLSKALGPVAAALVWSLSGGYDGVVVTLTAIAASSLLFFLAAMRMRAPSSPRSGNDLRVRSNYTND